MGLQLSDADGATLAAWTRKGSGELRRERRARIVLEIAEGGSCAAAAARLGTRRSTAGAWRRRFLAGGPKALEKDAPRPGRPRPGSPGTGLRRC